MAVKIRDVLRLLGVSATPGTLASGDVWYRTDTAQVQASDGQAGEPLTIGPAGNLPVIRPAGWHNVPAYGNAAGLAVSNGRLFAIPFWPGRSCTLTGVAANVTLALIGGTLRLGLYASDGVLPTTLVADYGTVSAGLTGITSATGLSTPVRPVLHYLAIARQGGGLSMSVSSRSSWEPIVSDTSPSIAANNNAYFIDSVTGALPGTFGTPAGTDQGPCLTVQLT